MIVIFSEIVLSKKDLGTSMVLEGEVSEKPGVITNLPKANYRLVEYDRNHIWPDEVVAPCWVYRIELAI